MDRNGNQRFLPLGGKFSAVGRHSKASTNIDIARTGLIGMEGLYGGASKRLSDWLTEGWLTSLVWSGNDRWQSYSGWSTDQEFNHNVITIHLPQYKGSNLLVPVSNTKIQKPEDSSSAWIKQTNKFFDQKARFKKTFSKYDLDCKLFFSNKDFYWLLCRKSWGKMLTIKEDNFKKYSK